MISNIWQYPQFMFQQLSGTGSTQILQNKLLQTRTCMVTVPVSCIIWCMIFYVKGSSWQLTLYL